MRALAARRSGRSGSLRLKDRKERRLDDHSLIVGVEHACHCLRYEILGRPGRPPPAASRGIARPLLLRHVQVGDRPIGGRCRRRRPSAAGRPRPGQGRASAARLPPVPKEQRPVPPAGDTLGRPVRVDRQAGHRPSVPAQRAHLHAPGVISTRLQARQQVAATKKALRSPSGGSRRPTRRLCCRPRPPAAWASTQVAPSTPRSRGASIGADRSAEVANAGERRAGEGRHRRTEAADAEQQRADAGALGRGVTGGRSRPTRPRRLRFCGPARRCA